VQACEGGERMIERRAVDGGGLVHVVQLKPPQHPVSFS
jgi:hypothetical protein